MNMNDIVDAVEQLSEEGVDIRRHLHMYPELSAMEYNTASYIEEKLDAYGIQHERIATTGVIGHIDNDPSYPTVVLRCDIDALPIQEERNTPYRSTCDGVMHACGHDAHTAALLCAAKVLNDMKHCHDRNILLVFQPGEEIGYGGRIIANSGLIDNAVMCFGIHTATTVPCGDMVIMEGANNASVDQFTIYIHGKSSHIAQPENGIDAAYASSQIVCKCKELAQRCREEYGALLGIGHITAGTTYNIVAGEGLIEGTIRAFSQETRQYLLTELKNICDACAEETGVTVELKNKDNTAPLINDPVITEQVYATAKRLFGEEHIITKREPSFTGDDMAEFMLKVPGCYAYIGSMDPDRPETIDVQHKPVFDIDENCIGIAAKLYACVGTGIME